jgi:hypothetical protein
MATELDVLKLVSERLAAAEIPFMLTGSLALAYYATPRMTREVDLVVQLSQDDVVPHRRSVFGRILHRPGRRPYGDYLTADVQSHASAISDQCRFHRS